MKSSIKTIAIYGYFGEENLGDELILKSITDMLWEIDDSIRINVIGTKPQNILKNHKNINRASTFYGKSFRSKLRLIKYSLWDYLKIVKESNCLIIASGGALSDWNPSSTETIFKLIEVFQKKNKPILMLGCGAGPISKPESRDVFYNVLKNVKNITLRDKISFDELDSIGLKNIKLTTDVVYSLEDKNLEDNNYVDRNKGKNIGVVISPIYSNPSKNEKYINSIIEYINLLKKNKFKITLIPFQYSEDINMMLEIKSYTGVQIDTSGKQNVWSLIDSIKSQDVIVGLRFHSVILSILLKIPVIPIIYHHKVYSVAKDFNLLEYSEEIGDGSNWRDRDINVNRLYDNTIKVYKNADRISLDLKEKISTKKNNNGNYIVLKRFIEGL